MGTHQNSSRFWWCWVVWLIFSKVTTRAMAQIVRFSYPVGMFFEVWWRNSLKKDCVCGAMQPACCYTTFLTTSTQMKRPHASIYITLGCAWITCALSGLLIYPTATAYISANTMFTDSNPSAHPLSDRNMCILKKAGFKPVRTTILSKSCHH